MAKRNKLEIIRDILKTVKENHNSIKPTPLLRKSNLSTKRFNEYFGYLLKKGFVAERSSKNESQKEINLTNKGFKYLEKYKSIVGFIEEFEL